ADTRPSLGPAPTFSTPLPGAAVPLPGTTIPGGTQIITPGVTPLAPGGGSFQTNPALPAGPPAGSFGTGSSYAPATDPYQSSTTSPTNGNRPSSPLQSSPTHSVFGSGYRGGSASIDDQS